MLALNHFYWWRLTMSDTELYLWECKDAPANLRLFVPKENSNGWLAFVPRGSTSELIGSMVMLCGSPGGAVLRFESEDGGIVLVGTHAPISPTKNRLAEKGPDFVLQPLR
jgi:hypothetical protein